MEFLLTFLINIAYLVAFGLTVLLFWRGYQLAFGNASGNNEPNNPATCSGCSCQSSADKA